MEPGVSARVVVEVVGAQGYFVGYYVGVQISNLVP